jgi:transcriptional regulator of arginine metabolism
MISKKARQARLWETARKREVRSQEEFLAFLRKEGVAVTQSTLSRDIRDLGLIKVRGRYQVPGEGRPGPPDDMLRRALSQFVVRTGMSGNIVMVRTSPGNAHSVAVVLDAAEWPEVLGTVAGDDTVFVLVRQGGSGRRVLARIREYSQ